MVLHLFVLKITIYIFFLGKCLKALNSDVVKFPDGLQSLEKHLYKLCHVI